MFMAPKRLYFLYSELKMSEDLSDGTPSEEKPEVIEMPSNEVLPQESLSRLVEAEILHESSQDQHEQVTQNVSNRKEGDIVINESPLTEKLVESLPSSLPSSEETAEHMPTECIETVSLDAEPELEETLQEQSNPVSNTFFSIKALLSLHCEDRILYNLRPVFHKNLGSYAENLHRDKLNCNTKLLKTRNSLISLCQCDINLVFPVWLQ